MAGIWINQEAASARVVLDLYTLPIIVSPANRKAIPSTLLADSWINHKATSARVALGQYTLPIIVSLANT